MSRSIANDGVSSSLPGGTVGQVPYQSAVGSTSFTGPGTAGQVLTSNGTAAPTFQSGVASGNITGGTAGQVVYQSAPNTTAFAGPGTAGQILFSNGATAPTFGSPTTPTFTTITGSGATGTYTSPAGALYIYVEMTGSGGGGGRSSSSTNAGGGGGSGGYIRFFAPAGSYSYTVGAIGVGGATDGADGTAGGDSIFGLVTCRGGNAGLANGTPGAITAANVTAYSAAISLNGSRGGAMHGSGTGLSSTGGDTPLTTVVPSQHSSITPNTSDFATGRPGGGGGHGITNAFTGSAGNGGIGRMIIQAFYL